MEGDMEWRGGCFNLIAKQVSKEVGGQP
jgi:hypothetical protein